MIKRITGLLAGLFIILTSHAQDSLNKPEPVRDFFASSLIIDNQSVVSPFKGGKELLIQHRFTKIDNIHDLFGLYGSSNIRLGFQYGITDRLMAGFSTEKANKMQEFYGKYAIIRQKTGGTPFALSYFANVCIDGRNKVIAYGPDYKFTNRLSYFHELILARKFSDRLSLEVAGSFSHFNAVDSTVQNDSWGLTFGGRFKIHNEISLIGEYDYGRWLKGVMLYQENTKPLPNYAFGFEIGTGTHAFQVFASTWDHMNLQENFTLNHKKDLMLGFNITVRL